MAGSVIVFIIFLSILVLVHELGHFWVAKRAGIWVEEFGFGIPPRIFGKKIGETIYSINLLPFGGFVRLHGESTDENVTKPKRAFLGKSIKVRSAVVIAGVVMNFVLAILAFSSVYTFTGIPETVDTGEVNVMSVVEGSPASETSLSSGDVVKSVDGIEISSSQEFIDIIDDKKGSSVDLTVKKSTGEEEKITLTPRVDPPQGQGPIGVAISSSKVEYRFPPFWQRPFLGAFYGFQEAIFWGGAITGGFIQIIGNLFAGQVPRDIAGPAGLFVITSEAQQAGIIPLINLLGIISVNLAILNIVPFPALDGGRLLFIFIEKIFGKRIVPKVESAIHAVGLAVLVGLILLITIREVGLIRSYGFSGYIDYISSGQVQ